MTSRSDDLRNTLDTLHLDPKAKEDRHYLVTVLRRLGYSEAEIQKAVQEADEVEVEAVIETEEPQADDRMIEVEYMASEEVREFEPVVRSRPAAAKPEPAWETFEAETWPEPSAVPAAQEEVMFVHVAPGQHVKTVREAPAEGWTDAGTAWTEEPVEESAWPEPDAVVEPEDASAHTDAQAEATAWPEAREQPAEAQTEAPLPWPEQVSEVDGGPSETHGGDQAVAEPEEPAIPDGPYVYNDYTLHARDVELSTGKKQRIYFFAKGEPRSGTPAAMPDGYEVRENERTGLPFLSKLSEE